MTMTTMTTQEDTINLGPISPDRRTFSNNKTTMIDSDGREDYFTTADEDKDQLLGPLLGPNPSNRTIKETSVAPQNDYHYMRRLALHILACFFVAAHLITSLHYLVFKGKLYATNLMDLTGIPWVLLIWLLEVIYFCGSLVAAFDHVLPPSNRPSCSLRESYHCPTVDILLPCCKEATEIPEESLLAALKQCYPRDRFRVLVLDDGNDDALKAVCQTLQAEAGGHVLYLRRAKVPGIPHHFKCGNLNFGLEHSDSEYVVMMDADMILHPSFLITLLPHIINSPNVAFVQIPQSFYNLPRGDPLNDSCMMGYDKVMVHRDSLGSATCVGTGALFRREHLNQIGGFQHQSITEDTTTAFALFNQGFESVYLNERLQIGLTPWTLEGYIKQRMRWGQGAIQQFKATWKIMLGNKSKLSFVQKTLFFWHTGYYFLSLANIILVATLAAILFWELDLTVGSEEMNRMLIIRLATSLICWRLYWFFMWLQVRQPTQSRNRDESHFWWMTPYFAKMIMNSLFAYKSTFQFVPTSTIDRTVASKEQSCCGKHQLGQLKHVKFHLGYIFIVTSLVISKLHVTFTYYGQGNCRKCFFILGISFFLLTTCVHMIVPVLHILWPTSFKSKDRKALLKYGTDGVPLFNPEDCVPRWHWSLFFFEAVSQAVLAFWVFVLWTMKLDKDTQWCKGVAR